MDGFCFIIQYFRMKTFYIICFLTILGMSSCIQYKEIDIQYLNKPEISIPNNFSNPIILINLSENKISDRKDRFDYAVDSLAAEEAALTLKEILNNSPWFEGLKLPIRKYYHNDNSKYIKPIPWEVIKNIANRDSADLVVSLEYIKIIEKTDSYRTQLDGVDYYYGSLNLPIYCYWRVYDIAKKQIPNGHLYRDTLLWDAKDFIPVTIGNQLPGYFSASAYAGNECGEKYANKIAPIWQNGKRILFHTGSPEMIAANLFAIKGQWIEAATEWQKVIILNKRKLSAKAAFNLALANEMLGKFDIALEWLRKAKKIYPLPEIDNYIITIESRIEKTLK